MIDLKFNLDEENGFSIRFISPKGDFDFRYDSENKEDLGKMFFRILLLFTNTPDKINISYPFIYDKNRKKAITTFFCNLKNEIPRAFQLYKYFEEIPIDTKIAVIPHCEISQAQLINITRELKIMNGHDVDFDTEKLLKAVEKYSIHSYGGRRYMSKLDKEVCRYCGKSKHETSFNMKAHAIPEFLGNKEFIDKNECDNCNEYFSNGIELQAAEFFGFERVFFEISGKGGQKKWSSRNHKMFKENGELKIVLHGEQESDYDILKDGITLISDKKIKPSNIYRLLTKCVISTLNKEDLMYFHDTISWILGEDCSQCLPKVACSVNHPFVSSEDGDFLLRYIRNDYSNDLPYLVGKLILGHFAYMYIVPLCKNDTIDFSVDSNYNIFWEYFVSIHNYCDWSFMDLSSNKESEFTKRLNLELQSGN